MILLFNFTCFNFFLKTWEKNAERRGSLGPTTIVLFFGLLRLLLSQWREITTRIKVLGLGPFGIECRAGGHMRMFFIMSLHFISIFIYLYGLLRPNKLTNEGVPKAPHKPKKYSHPNKRFMVSSRWWSIPSMIRSRSMKRLITSQAKQDDCWPTKWSWTIAGW